MDSDKSREQNGASVDQLAKRMKTRLQYARFKVQNGMANQSLDQMESKVDRQLANMESIDKSTSHELPPTPPQSSHRGEEERAARNLMMISSSPVPPKLLKRPRADSPSLPSFQDIVAHVPDYDEKSRRLAESLRSPPPPPPGPLPVDPGSISSRFPYFPPVNWTGALSSVGSSYYSNSPSSPGQRYSRSRR